MSEHLRLNQSVLSAAISTATINPARSNSSFKIAVFAASGLVLLGSSIMSFPVLAQEETVAEEITVTGSRIRRQDFTANSPITTVDSATFENTSTVGIESILNRLPQFVPSVTQFTTTDVQNTATNTIGASTVSLRGLGANRNLVLLDGRRAQPVNAALVVDTNTIPTAAIERVEVISGGASAVYGADAVGGVVNFILKDDFQGLDFDTQYGLTEEGDGEEYRVSALFGANLINGGNVMFGIEHANRQEVEQNDRSWRVRDLNNPSIPGSEFWFSESSVSSVTPGNTPSQGAVDSVFPALGSGTISPSSDFFINPTPDGTGSVFTGAGTFTGAAGAPGAYKYNGPLTREEYPGVAWRKFNPDGSIDENQLNNWVSIPMERFSSFGRASFDINANVTAMIQGNFSRVKNETLLGQYAAALGRHGASAPYGNELYEPSLNEDGSTNAAFLPGGAYDLNCPQMGGCTETQAFPLPQEIRTLLDSRENPNDDIFINRNLDFMGSRRSRNETTQFQIMAGLEGTMNNNWFWDAHISHGETETLANFQNFSSVQRWRALVSSPNFGRNFSQTGNVEGGGGAAGTATCQTGLPVVQEFEMSEDCFAAMGVNLQNNSQLEQTVAEANLSGDIMPLPAGMLQFALGGAWRENTYRFTTDNLTLFESFVEQAVGLRPGGSSEGEFDVSEIYGELLIPVVADLPGIQRLDLELGGRYSDYSTVGGVNTYKALIDWTINDWARLRGGFQKANRAPNIGELFLSRTQSFGGGGGIYGDQCSMNNDIGPYSPNPDYNIGGAEGAAFARSLCEQLMGETGAMIYYDRAIEDQPEGGGASSPNIRGNLDLDSEEADTWTAGLVLNSPFQGAFLSGLTASIDYYNIEITDMIATESSDAVYARCLDPALNPTGSVQADACQSIQRDPLTGNPIGIDITYTNQGRSETSGVDLQLDWSGDFASLGVDAIPGGLSVNILANYNIDNITQEQEDLPEIDWAGTQGCALGLECMGYDYRIFTTVNYFVGPFSATLRWQHLPDIDANTAATTPDTTDIGIPDSYNIFALTGSYQLNQNMLFRFGVENLLNEKPPRGGGDPDATAYPQAQSRQYGAYYDPLGRRYFAGFNLSF